MKTPDRPDFPKCPPPALLLSGVNGDSAVGRAASFLLDSGGFHSPTQTKSALRTMLDSHPSHGSQTQPVVDPGTDAARDRLSFKPLSFGSNKSSDEDVVTGRSKWDETYLDPILVPIGPVTRACVNKFKDALMGLIRATWSQAIAWRPIEGITSDDQPNKCVIQVLEETE
ncbi:hypothetical protein TIFTF001_040219 [Ficus carica]|uniref:Uncharacterized protein n=1 Tax=Ficus carica TaxID=3494 RepID=A0AA87Z1M3_FICCA|nr:hypothetical protein TIFTF001_040219 [Ficus carica]